MAFPVDTFKNNLFGQLKSYSNAVQGVFEQRIARPILALKRDLSRPTSEARTTPDHDVETSSRARQGSTSSSSPLEIIEIDASGSFKSIFDKVKNTFSPSTKRRTLDNTTTVITVDDDSTKQAKVYSKASRKAFLQSRKSVSFADDVDADSDSDSDINNQYSVDDRNTIVQNARTLADQILLDSIDEISMNKYSEDDFIDDFHHTIRPRRISSNNVEDLVYQDLSAEIVAYVLKHALRTIKKEQEQITSETEHTNDDDFIDLK
ncbi:unnamed protein product [Adineta ricciae]|uniref:Uncharacterized protein n=1 Tax=Adineta ricciae TaxID=249248 RepID=A0A815KPV1_ADIRI|nr:unnamed protein product [Adineta ricciae]CAF1393910.1 unnamed protein product [Adineta ricciae]